MKKLIRKLRAMLPPVEDYPAVELLVDDPDQDDAIALEEFAHERAE